MAEMARIDENIHALPQETSIKRQCPNQDDDFFTPSKKGNADAAEKENVSGTIDQLNIKKSNCLYASEKYISTSQNYIHVDNINDGSTKAYQDIESYEPLWKYTNNSSVMKYRWMRHLRNQILFDLKRHFGREVKHNRLFSCLCKLADLN